MKYGKLTGALALATTLAMVSPAMALNTRNTIDGYDKKAIPMLVADKRMARSVPAQSVVDPQFYQYAEKTAPQYFSDLPPIPADRRL